jgi:hypothetical protein
VHDTIPSSSFVSESIINTRELISTKWKKKKRKKAAPTLPIGCRRRLFFFLKKSKKSKSIKRIGLDTKFSTGELLFFSLLFGSVDEKFNNKKLNTKKKNKKTFLRTSSGNVIQLRERYGDIIRESCCFVVSWMRIRPPFHFTCIIDTH